MLLNTEYRIFFWLVFIYCVVQLGLDTMQYLNTVKKWRTGKFLLFQAVEIVFLEENIEEINITIYTKKKIANCLIAMDIEKG